MVLLITLALACAIATVAESKFNSDVARYYIYKAPWFLLWLMALVVNLVCVILSRWPWQRKHLSFIVAHIGIITLLAGAVIGQRWGFEGFMNLEVGRPLEGRVVLNQTILDVRMPQSGVSYEAPLPVAVRRPSEARPRVLAVPQSPYHLKIDGYSETVGTTEHLAPALVPITGAIDVSNLGPGVELKLSNPGMKQEVPMVLLQKDPERRVRDFFGLASVEWDDALATNPPDALPMLRVSLTPQGTVPFVLLRAGRPYAHGVLQPGVPVALGWSDWRVTLVGTQAQAGIATEVTENPDDADSAPGVRATLLGAGGTIDGPFWIPSGGARMFRTPDGAPLQVGFGLRTMPLPFGVRLLKFEVPRDEGTETPADFIATVRFEGRDGATKTGEAHMNYPASFPGGFWRSVIGQNFKFSQASWNPQNLNQTTLQVLFDPGWPLKWVGSILIVLGVALLFYYKPHTRPTATPSSLP